MAVPNTPFVFRSAGIVDRIVCSYSAEYCGENFGEYVVADTKSNINSIDNVCGPVFVTV